MLQTLIRVGDSLVITIPEAFIEQNNLQEGSEVKLSFEGARMTVNAPTKRRYKLEELLAEMPGGKLSKVEGWDEMPLAGLEAL